MVTRFDKSEPPRTAEVNAALHIARGKVLVVGVSLSGGAAAGNAVLYNGESAVETPLLTLTVLANTTVAETFPHGILCDHGLFVTVSAATLFLTISYYTGIDEHETKPLNGSD